MFDGRCVLDEKGVTNSQIPSRIFVKEISSNSRLTGPSGPPARVDPGSNSNAGRSCGEDNRVAFARVFNRVALCGDSVGTAAVHAPHLLCGRRVLRDGARCVGAVVVRLRRGLRYMELAPFVRLRR